MRSRLVCSLLLLAFAVRPTPAFAAVGDVLSELLIGDASGGFTGVLQDADRFGWDVASLGDVDGDGIGDLAVGAPRDDDGQNNAGAVWILFLAADGSVKPSGTAKISATSGGFTGAIPADARFGSGVTWLGNPAGSPAVARLAIGARGVDGFTGEVWILDIDATGAQAAPPVRIPHPDGVAGDIFGGSVAAVGDLNGDGLVDLAVGAAGHDDGGADTGAVWVFLMGAHGHPIGHAHLSISDAPLAGLDPGSTFGQDVSALGDVDGDGVPDLAVGADRDDGAGTQRGAVWIVNLDRFGQAAGATRIGDGSGSLTLDDVDLFGSGVHLMGDLDGDGVPDLAVGASADDDGGTNRGAVYVLFLNANGTLKGHAKISDTAGGFGGTLVDSDNFGSSVESLGDRDADGAIELAVGAFLANGAGTDRGAVWIVEVEGSAPVCGDGVVAPPEECDDGGTSAGGGCSATCRLERRLRLYGCSSFCSGTLEVTVAGVPISVPVPFPGSATGALEDLRAAIQSTVPGVSAVVEEHTLYLDAPYSIDALPTGLSTGPGAGRGIEREYSRDIDLEDFGLFVPDDRLLLWAVFTSTSVVYLGPVTEPVRVDLRGISRTAIGDDLLAFDVAVELPALGGGTLVVQPGDVASYTPFSGVYRLAFDGSAAGVPRGVRVDAIADRNGALLLSFDVSFQLGPHLVADEDVLVWDGSVLRPFLDLSALGFPGNLDVDALAYAAATDTVLLSFDTTGEVAGLAFDAGSVMALELATGHLELTLAIPSREEVRSCFGCFLPDGISGVNLDAWRTEIDSDHDGLPDDEESAEGTDLFDPDSDDDGLTDGDELNVYGTDPLLADTDGDTVKDGDEIAAGTDPLNPLSAPAGGALLPTLSPTGVALLAFLLLATALAMKREMALDRRRHR